MGAIDLTPTMANSYAAFQSVITISQDNVKLICDSHQRITTYPGFPTDIIILSGQNNEVSGCNFAAENMSNHVVIHIEGSGDEVTRNRSDNADLCREWSMQCARRLSNCDHWRRHAGRRNSTDHQPAAPLL
jgi:hypothetical protein